MELIKCPVCEKDIDFEPKRCPNCGCLITSHYINTYFKLDDNSKTDEESFDYPLPIGDAWSDKWIYKLNIIPRILWFVMMISLIVSIILFVITLILGTSSSVSVVLIFVSIALWVVFATSIFVNQWYLRDIQIITEKIDGYTILVLSDPFGSKMIIENVIQDHGYNKIALYGVLPNTVKVSAKSNWAGGNYYITAEITKDLKGE